MISSTSKKGRPQAFHRTSWGKRIDGLTRLADGRWKVSGEKVVKFTEPDEQLAVARFHEIMAARSASENLGEAKAHETFGDAFKDVLKRAKSVGGTLTASVGQPSVNNGSFVVTDETLSPAQWAWLRKAILSKPQWVAERVGIERIGWLRDMKEPTATPKLAELGELYAAKPGLSTNEAGRSRLFWREFCRAVGVATVREITHENIAQYEKVILGKKYAPKSVLHRYRKIRTIIAYALKRGRGVEDCRHALDVTAMLEVKNHSPLDPKPISPADFWKIHDAAIAAGDATFATLMLVALNAAMYGGEVAALKWDEIDLKKAELVTRRPKTGVSRVTILWPEVIAALKKLPREGDSLFYTRVRSYTVYSVLDAWRKYRTAAKLGDEIVFSMIRDAGFTTACRVSLDQARVLAGHRMPGAADHYIRRDPQFVATACEAIRKAFKRK